MTNTNLSGKTVLVIGGSAGIGLDIARIAADSCTVIATWSTGPIASKSRSSDSCDLASQR